jgi:hypothetical protein
MVCGGGSPTKKVVGKITPSEEKFYCSAGTITTNRISYGVNKSISTKKQKVYQKRRICVKNTTEGRDLVFQCKPCSNTAAQVCPLGNGDFLPVVLVGEPVQKCCTVTNCTQVCKK